MPRSMGVFWRPIDQEQVLTTRSGGRQNGLFLNKIIYGCVTSQHSWLVNQILTSNKKATINLLNLLLGLNQFCTLHVCLALNIHKHVYSEE